MIKRLLSALGALIVLSGATPAWAGSGFLMIWIQPKLVPATPPILGFPSWERFVQWQGCPAEVLIAETGQVNAVYQSGPNRILIFRGLMDFFQNDELSIAAVLAHEAGHCLQVRGKSPWLDPNKPGYSVGNATPFGWERDAEAHSVYILRILGYDGAAINRANRVKFAQRDGRALDRDTGTHGSVETMSDWARLHDGIGRSEIQAPLR